MYMYIYIYINISYTYYIYIYIYIMNAVERVQDGVAGAVGGRGAAVCLAGYIYIYIYYRERDIMLPLIIPLP